MADRLTQRSIAKLVPPEKGNRICYDGEISGFGARITSAGVISFVLNYYTHGRERRFTIGRYPELTVTAAREKAVQLRGHILNGFDPLADRERQREEPTVAELATQYLNRYACTHKRPSSIRNDREMIERIIRPRLGVLRISAVNRRDIEDLHSSLRHTPYRANRVLSLLSKMFGIATEWGWSEDNPARGIPRFQEDRRERWLTIDELRKFTEALDSYHDQNAANALRLLILTGARAGEVLKANWSQFDLDRGTWIKPSHHTKQKRVEHVPLSSPALDLLRTMNRDSSKGQLFPGAAGTARVSLRRPWVQVYKAAGLVSIEVIQGKRRSLTRFHPTLRIHDLRHTYASHLVSNGFSLHVVGKLLGHTQAATTMRYAHVADDALRFATDKFGAIITRFTEQSDEEAKK